MSKNHLSTETSPYLLAHADNPVDWYPWCEQALLRAKREHKPICLSIGYSACHWCHVMAHESFSHPATAAIMNEYFVNIKVDREERPDLDKIYQTTHQLITQSGGGWPLTVFLHPDCHTPFFSGTYFPLHARYGMPSFRQVLQKVKEFYDNNEHSMADENKRIVTILDQLHTIKMDQQARLNDSLIHKAYQQLTGQFDRSHGGFARAPKFPHANNSEFLLQFSNKPEALDMVIMTLTKMAKGGIYDHIGGGFFRYSVDEKWMIPHFEKMLYDNGPLLNLYLHAYSVSKNPLFATIAEQTANWMIDEMQSQQGGFYATLDADSEGMEGQYYVWQRDELLKILSDDEYTLFSKLYNIEQDANFEGQWHLHIVNEITPLATQLNIEVEQARNILQSAHDKLQHARKTRSYPHRDEKIMTAWNGLAIKALFSAGKVLANERFIQSAENALSFIKQHCWQQSRLMATYKDGQNKYHAYLDDYAFLLEALLQALQTRWRNEDFIWACELADGLLQHFYDQDNAGFYFTAHDSEVLLSRPKVLLDEATPSGLGVATYALQRLGFLTGNTTYLDAVEKTLKACWLAMHDITFSHISLLMCLEEYLNPVETIIIRGEKNTLTSWLTELNKKPHPHRQIFAIDNTTSLPSLLAHYKAIDHKTIAYQCQGLQCHEPVESVEQLNFSLES